MNWKHFVAHSFVVLLLVYLTLGVFLFLNQKSMIYFPSSQDFEHCSMLPGYSALTYNGTRFYSLERSNESVIIYYHGNAGSACDRGFTRSTFEQANSSLLFVEYAGYSNDERKPSKKLLLQDARNIHSYIEEKSYNTVIVYGQSIGSGIASYHASLGGVDSLILVSPFAQLLEIAQLQYRIYPASILLTEDYDSIAWLEAYQGDLTIIHGDSDTIIPYASSQRLFDSVATDKKEYVLIEGAGHNTMWNFEEFKEKVATAINTSLMNLKN